MFLGVATRCVSFFLGLELTFDLWHEPRLLVLIPLHTCQKTFYVVGL